MPSSVTTAIPACLTPFLTKEHQCIILDLGFLRADQLSQVRQHNFLPHMSVQDFPLPLVEGIQGLGSDRSLKLSLSLSKPGSGI
jgi:hypothetical protein